MNISSIIKQFGYKPNEAKVYLAALYSLDSTASDIATKAKIPLSSAEVALKKLHKDGLVNFYTRKSRKYWIAEPPERLVEAFKTKEEDLAMALADIKPAKQKEKGKPRIEVFIGDDEIKNIHRRMIDEKHKISAIIPWEAWRSLLGEEFLRHFIAHRVKHFLSIRMLAPKTPATTKMKGRDTEELRHTKFLPENVDIEDAMFLFGDNVALITLNERQPTGVIIEDAATTRMMRVFFEDLWERAN